MEKERLRWLIFSLIAAIITIAIFILRWFEAKEQPFAGDTPMPPVPPAPPVMGDDSTTPPDPPVDTTPPVEQTVLVEGTPSLRSFTLSSPQDTYAVRNATADVLEQGFDFFAYAPIGINTKKDEGGGVWEINSWVQEFVLATNPLNVIKRGEMTYYVKPTWQANTARSTFDFWEKFPAFTPPANKVVAMAYQNKADVLQNGAMSLARGVTHTQHTNTKASKVLQAGDGMWHEIGCPSGNPYAAGYKDAFATWLASVSAQTVLQKVLDVFGAINATATIGFFNNESIVHPDGTNQVIADNFYKIADAYQAAAAQFPNLKFLVFGNNIFQYSYYSASNVVGNIKSAYLDASTNALDLANRFSLNTATFLVGQHCSMVQAYGSNDSPYHPGDLQLSLMSFLLQKKCYPNKQFVFFPYAYYEFLSYTTPLMPSYFNLPDGASVYQWEKPVMFPSALYNRAIWGIALLDGIYFWGEPRIETENKANYEWYTDAAMNASMGTIRSLDNQPLTTGLNEVINGHRVEYFNPSMKCIDWCMAGVWTLSQPETKSIIEAPGAFEWINDPFVSYEQNKPLVAAKTHNGKTLVLAYYHKAEGEVQHNVTINGVAKTISTFGDITSVVVY